MGRANSKMQAAKTWQKMQQKMERQTHINEPRSSVREARQGFRGFGAFQLKRIYSAEGVHVIDIGGPPVAGR